MATDLSIPTEELSDEFLKQVYALSPKARKELNLILDELDSPPPPSDVTDWKAEIQRRLELVRSGKAELLDGQEVLDRIRAKLQAQGLK